MNRSIRTVLLAVAFAIALPVVAFAKSGDIFVGDDGGGDVIRLNPKTGDQKQIADQSSSKLVAPVGGAFKGKNLYIADYELPGVARINPKSGHVRVVKKNGPFSEPLDLDIGPDGRGYVAEEQGAVGIIRVNLKTGSTKRIAKGGDLTDPYALVFKGNKILVADRDTGIVQVDPDTGDQKIICDDPDIAPRGVAFIGNTVYANDGFNTVFEVESKHSATSVADGGDLVGLYDMAPAPHHRLYTANTTSGKVVRVDPSNGDQKVVGEGGDLDSPEGLTIQP
jgi:streptogramin lyase